MQGNMDDVNDLIRERGNNLQAIRQMGVEPYGGRVEDLMEIASVLEAFEEGKSAKVAGRLMAWRSHGKTIFADLLDATGRIQLFMKKTELPEDVARVMEHLDIGDIVAVSGELFKTKTDMPTLRVTELSLMSKSLRPMPEKWHGLKDVETRYRQRYADLISSEEVRQIFKKRSRIISKIRNFLDSKNYLEVETPMMHSIPGGAAGKPFKTHHEALGIELFMRVAPELYLKRLLVGGLDRVYEINKSFRNEGISTRHNPEFTMLEVYTSFADVEDVMRLTEDIIRETAQAVLGTTVLKWQDMELDLSRFERISFADLMQDAFGIAPDDELGVWVKKLKEKGIEVEGGSDLSRSKLVKIVGELIEPKKHRHPVFVTDYFTELCPLAKRRKDNPHISERFELFMGGMEIANGYSELNDPEEQRQRFEDDLKTGIFGEEGRIDEDFVRALEFGMPPAGGLGIGIDRLVMILTNQPSIREVILFPQLKPEKK